MKFVDSVKDVLAVTKVKVAAKSPEILLVTGIVSAVAATVVACVKTSKVKEEVDDIKKNMEYVHNIENCSEEVKSKYSKKDKAKDIIRIYSHGIRHIALDYSIPAGLMALSVVCICSSYGIMKKRNAALVAAYQTIETAFSKYRKNVIDRYGKDVDWELEHGLKATTVKEKVVDPETGAKKTVEKTVYEKVGEDINSPFTKLWGPDGDSALWPIYARDPVQARYQLVLFQEEANDILKARKVLTLNDVYDILHIPRTVMGYQVGWVYNSSRGDGYVSFGIQENEAYSAGHNQAIRDWNKGYEDNLWLIFNVDGLISEEAQKLGYINKF